MPWLRSVIWPLPGRVTKPSSICPPFASTRVSASSKGPSGCGKSTLLGLLAGIQTANHGTLEVLGQPLARLSGRAVTSSGRPISVHLPAVQSAAVFSVQDNVTAALTFSPAKAGPPDRGAPSRRRAACWQNCNCRMRHSIARPALSIGSSGLPPPAPLIGSPPGGSPTGPPRPWTPDNRAAFIRLLFEECDKRGSTWSSSVTIPIWSPSSPGGEPATAQPEGGMTTRHHRSPSGHLPFTAEASC